MSGNWRGTVGVVKPNYTTGSLVEFIRLLPEGINVIPLRAGIEYLTEEGFRDSLESYRQRVAELAEMGVCDLIHPEGAPPFMVRGLDTERALVQEWEAQYKVPVFTSGMTQVAALRALGIQRFVGFTFLGGPLLDIFARYFTEAGFDVAGMEAVPRPPAEWAHPSTEDLYLHIKRAVRKYSDVQGIYMLGSGSWRVTDIPPLEEDLGIAVVHPVAARVWYVQKQLQIRQPVKGAGRLLETMP